MNLSDSFVNRKGQDIVAFGFDCGGLAALIAGIVDIAVYNEL